MIGGVARLPGLGGGSAEANISVRWESGRKEIYVLD